MPIVARGDSPDVVALLPTMLGNVDRVRACIESLRALAGDARLAVLCVVNSSTADAATLDDLGIEVEVAGANLGWAGGLGFGIAITSSPLVWFVQDDMVLEPASLLELMAALRADRSLGLVGPIVLDDDGMVAQGSLGGYIDDNGEISRWIPETAIPASEVAALPTPGYVPSRGMLVTRAALEKVGPPDPRLYPVQFVDVDFCLRLQAAGIGLRIVPSAVTTHGGKGSTPQGFAEFLNTRNSMRIHAKHFSDQPLPTDRFFPVVASRPDPPDAQHHPLHPRLPAGITTQVIQSAADTLTDLARVFTYDRTASQSRIASLGADAEQARAGLEQVRAELERTRADLDAERAALEQARAELHATNTELDATRADRDAAKAELDRARASLDETEANLDESLAHIAAVQSSTSWRVTAPLRRVGGLFRR